MQSNTIKDQAFFIGFFLINLIAVILVLCSLTFFAGASVTPLHFPTAILLTAILNYFIIKQQYNVNYNKLFLRSVFLSLIIVGTSVLIAGFFFDVSYDGQAYHQETLIQLKNGWNPYYQTLSKNVNQSLYINYYAKGAEIPQSTIYAFFNKIETGKATNLILLAGSFLITLSLLLELNITTIKKAVFISVLFVLNPITVNQILTYYVDGQLATLMLCLFITSVLIIKKVTIANLLLLGSIVIISINIKFTSVIYVAVFMLALIALLVYDKQSVKLKKVFSALFIGGVLALMVGFNPYVKNTVQHHHPFYPLLGSEKIDIMSMNTPAGLEGKPALQKLFISIFSHTDNVLPSNGKLPEFKIPFSINKADIVNASKIDTRIAGFGPFFSGILILSVVLFLSFVFGNPNKRLVKYLIFISVTILISSLINPESWWARYIPQLWLFPIIVLTVAESYENKIVFWTKQLSTIAIVINIIFTFTSIIWNLAMTSQINYQMSRLKNANQIINVQWGSAKSNRIRFDEYAIRYREQNLDTEASVEKVIHSDSMFSIPKLNFNNSKKPQLLNWIEKYMPQTDK